MFYSPSPEYTCKTCALLSTYGVKLDSKASSITANGKVDCESYNMSQFKLGQKCF